ncbi:MAG: ABC transporter permease subunit [Alphaproteobacteria bacterium]|nr:ABC transporter permease subunit [Alphaproteobacteria bacterium]
MVNSRTTNIPLWVRIAPALTIAVLVGPVIAGLAGIALPAVGFAPLGGSSAFTLSAFARVTAEPGFFTSLWLAFWIGPVSALISLTLVTGFAAAAAGTRSFAFVAGLLRPVLALPHAAAAFGLVYLVSPSGFLLRLVSPELTGFSRPPDWLIVNDPMGLALLAGLVLKEAPYLFLALTSALQQADPRRADIARALGHSRMAAWLHGVFPAVYAQMRLPIMAVIVFSSSVVDMAMILGPATPPLLSLRILGWINDPDFSQKSLAAAALVFQLGASGAGLVVWLAGERLVSGMARRLAVSGIRLPGLPGVSMLARSGLVVVALVVLAGIGLVAVNSVAGIWRFPDALPRGLNLTVWAERAPELMNLTANTVLIGGLASLTALIAVMLCLENEYRSGITLSPRAKLVLYAPLLVPQIGFLPGLTVLLLRLGWDGSLLPVAFAHLVFVLPYTYLMLADPWNAFDTRYLDTARALGRSPDAALLTIRLPMLVGPILVAFALGFAVSVAQYLPTLLIGGGRVPTITTEAVALSSGGNRRLIGAYALVQSLLPFLGFALAAAVPALLWRDRRALRSGGVV